MAAGTAASASLMRAQYRQDTTVKSAVTTQAQYLPLQAMAAGPAISANPTREASNPDTCVKSAATTQAQYLPLQVMAAGMAASASLRGKGEDNLEQKTFSMEKYTELASLLKGKSQNRIDFIRQISPMLGRRRGIIEKCLKDSEESLNIFTDLSTDRRFNEVNHSRMLRKILTPSTPEIGDIEYFKIFVELIEKIKGMPLKHKFDGNFLVETEIGRSGDINESGSIDILISDDEYSIIIENKITRLAGDQENQLARYYTISKELKKTPVAIVYMPFYYGEPPIDYYSGEYSKLIGKIRELLIILPAIDPKNQNDIVHGFLDKCSHYARSIDNYTAAVCLDQYSRLIKSKLEVDQMAMNEDRDLIEKILSDNEMKKTVEDIYEIWSSRFKTLGPIFLDHFINQHGFKAFNGYYGKKISEDLFIFFAANANYEFGFGSIKEDTIPKKLQNDLKQIIDKNSDFLYFKNASSTWVYGFVRQESLRGNLAEMKEFFSSNLRKFEEDFSELKQGGI